MQRAAISKLKSSLSGYLERVKAGEEVIVTDRGKPVARLVPYTLDGPDPDDIDDLVHAGLMRRRTAKLPDDFWDQPLVPDPEGFVLKALLDEREEGW